MLNSVPFKAWLMQFVDKFDQVISPKLINWSEFKLIWINECEALEAQIQCFASSGVLRSESR